MGCLTNMMEDFPSNFNEILLYFSGEIAGFPGYEKKLFRKRLIILLRLSWKLMAKYY